MIQQIKFVEQRDGLQGAREYAERALQAYRNAARYRSEGKRHFAHAMPYRPHFVRSVIVLRNYLKGMK